ncbi:unnamed protein product [Rhizoctonia solani]|uniref:Transmembrane protein, putative n=2 Tax=Rhizoctonia solani AG-3 TaxID=1086053 RepID=X8JHD6_9AGAM|nr:transmembrane protein, putative [Rhizoctonia solani AG-3 Rhs1AP]KEP50387.1 putative transmembrane protein [Rhizoctonia solani 123E]CAE6442788.1 unnamed protein product [Rhizoctonia solani]
MATRKDFDSRSQVSSFYGRPSSQMNIDSAAQPPQPVNRRDSNSSFFRPDEYGASGDYDSANRRGGGYDRSSYIGLDNPKGDIGAAGKDEEWDVYADFNNAGPRYATTPFQQDTGYRAIRGGGSEASAANQVELVTVPALGAEWKAAELRDMTKSGRSELRAEERRKKWREFNRDQRGLCGISWAKRTTLAWAVFLLICVIGVLLAIFIPRVPGFGFQGDMPLNVTTDGGNPQFSRIPANFSFDALVSLQVNTNSQVVLPLHFNNIHATIYDVTTSRQVAEGDLGGYTVPAKAFSQVKVPVKFSYEAGNASDVTWLNFYNACKSKSQTSDGTRPGLQLRLVLEMSIAGLIGKPTAGTQISDANCPIELSANAA